MNSPLRLLVIGAHPADIFDQSGGTMAHHIQRGDWVGAVVLTHGARIHDKVISDEMFHKDEVPDGDQLEQMMAERADLKSAEVVRACEMLGLEASDVFFFGADDAVLLVNEDTVRRVARMIRQLRPNIIITHFPMEDGGIASPHAITGQIVMHAIQLAGAVDPGDHHPPHKVAQVFYFGIGAAAVRRDLWGTMPGFTNDVFIDITDVIETKLAAIDAIASQGYDGAYARKRVETSDGSFGKCVNRAYAEGFITLRSSTHRYLPLSELDLQASKESDQQVIARRSYRLPL